MQRQRGGDGFGRVPALLLAGLLSLGAFSQAMATHLGKHCLHDSSKAPDVSIVNGVGVGDSNGDRIKFFPSVSIVNNADTRDWKLFDERELRTFVGRPGSRIAFDIFFDECLFTNITPRVEVWIDNRKVATKQSGRWASAKHYRHIDNSRFITDTFVVGADWPDGHIAVAISNFKDVGLGLNVGEEAFIRRFTDVSGRGSLVPRSKPEAYVIARDQF